MSLAAAKPPRAMENCFSDTQPCDQCGTAFKGREFIWVWNEYTCCTRACLMKCKSADERERGAHPALGAPYKPEEKDIDLL